MLVFENCSFPASRAAHFTKTLNHRGMAHFYFPQKYSFFYGHKTD
jgi:hypothetical protein